ncbi:pirin family protein [Pseudoalteromonas sp. S16_S37]|uniref:pirin family protein n=1 Tax=Pseudoalteromonas sp. S16_S37 TaxID=2720228 RepID=UPI00168056B4|nr:pirin family protein [Pseudoalteromonas sp. S16_S37]MBD1584533.1 pirin family protein [Pseudoalteromonas sp. S16_S37]
MSNISKALEHQCTVASGCRALKLILTPKDKDLGGLSVRRTLPVRGCRSVGPWVFFDHMGPAHFKAGQSVDVKPHPHIGLATVTYLFEGEMLHRDSLGSEQTIVPGDINLMVAGRGIVHSERQREEVKSAPHTLHGLQLWLALPTQDEQCESAFFHYASADIPSVSENEVPIRVLIGEAYGVVSPVKTFSNTLYVEARMQAGQSLVLPEVDELALYVVTGQLSVLDNVLAEHNMAVFTKDAGITVKALEDTTIALIGGTSVGKRYMDWNFVASDKSLIEQAKHNWKTGQFPKVPNDDVEFIPLPKW